MGVERVVGEEERRFFMDKGYLVLKGVLSAQHLSALEKRCHLYAPNPELIHQYAQQDDCRRFEYSLSQVPPLALDAEARRQKMSDCGHNENIKQKQEAVQQKKRKNLDANGGDNIVNITNQEISADSNPFQIPLLSEICKSICSKLSAAEAFCIVSKPGSKDQPAHTDSIPMEGQSEESWKASLHYLGMLIPLQETNEISGKTAIVPRSHLMSSQADESEIQVSMNRGDVLVLDGRTTHRGLANVSKEEDGGVVRKLCFFTFTLPAVLDGNSLAYSEDKAEKKRKI